jgi:hypothetical protein
MDKSSRLANIKEVATFLEKDEYPTHGTLLHTQMKWKMEEAPHQKNLTTICCMQPTLLLLIVICIQS